MIQGTILSILHGSFNDGPGIRTTVFLKGCPLRCAWCHNPESQSRAPQLRFIEERCTGCKQCETVCGAGAHVFSDGKHSVDFGKCTQCLECVAACPSQALLREGNLLTADQVMDEVLKDRQFYERTGGGMTISGGEPLFQPEFTKALLERARENGIHTCVETCGFTQSETLQKVLPFIDLLLFDIKGMDPTIHKRYTAVDNAVILDNFETAYRSGKRIIVRLPLVPGVNDSSEQITLIIDFLKLHPGIAGFEIMPYHSTGIGKAGQIGMQNPLGAVPDALESDITRWRTIFLKAGLGEKML